VDPDRRTCDFGNPSSKNIPATWCRCEVPGRPDDREFIMSKEKQENDRPAALAMIEELCQRYLKTFTHEPHDVRPLARGIHKAIVADASDLPASIVSQALATYAAWLPYLRACIAGAPRIDLRGDPAGVVTEKEATYAAQRFGSTGTQPRRGQS
jgi:ProP effector